MNERLNGWMDEYSNEWVISIDDNYERTSVKVESSAVVSVHMWY